MGEYTTIQGLDRARYETLLNAPLPNPLPANAVLVVGADWCPDTQHTIMDSGYATQTRDGRPIIYLNDANPAAHNVLRGLPGKEVLGGSIDSETPPSRPTRQYNYPTVVTVREGALASVIYADTVPAGGLLDPAALEQQWAAGAAERARRASLPAFEPQRAAPLFENAMPAALEPNRVYAVISSNCGHCHELLARGNYPQRTEDGRPITYINLATAPDGQTAANPGAAAFFNANLANLNVQGFPTFISTDAQGRPSISAVGPDRIIGQFFPAVQQAEAARGLNTGPTPQVAAAPPPPPASPAAPADVAIAEGRAEFTFTEGTDRISVRINRGEGASSIRVTTRNAAGAETIRDAVFMPDGTVSSNDSQGFEAPRTAQRFQTLIDGWVSNGRFDATEARAAIALVNGAAAEIQAEVNPTAASPAPQPANGPRPAAAAAAAAPVAGAIPGLASGPLRRGTGEWVPAPDTMQGQLLDVGIMFGNNKTNPAVVTALETFYRATTGRAMATPGTLSETEHTEILNLMQGAAFDPAKQQALRDLGAAMGINITTLPNMTPNAPGVGAVAAAPAVAPNVLAAAADAGAGARNVGAAAAAEGEPAAIPVRIGGAVQDAGRGGRP